MDGHDAVVHFAAETHVDRSITGRPTRSCARTASAPTCCATSPAGRRRALPAHLHRRGLRLDRGRLVQRDRRARAALAVLGGQGRQRPHRAQLLHHPRPAGPRHPLLATTSGRTSSRRRSSRCSPPTCSTARRCRCTATAATSATGSTSTTTTRAADLVLRSRATVGEIYNIGAGNEITNHELTLPAARADRAGRELHRRRSRIGSATTAATRSHTTRSRRSAGRPSTTSTRRWRATVDWYRDNRDWWEPLKAKRRPRRCGCSSPAPAGSSATTSSRSAARRPATTSSRSITPRSTSPTRRRLGRRSSTPRPDAVINCAAWTAVDACESEPRVARAINAVAVRWLAEACRRSRRPPRARQHRLRVRRHARSPVPRVGRDRTRSPCTARPS